MLLNFCLLLQGGDGGVSGKNLEGWKGNYFSPPVIKNGSMVCSNLTTFIWNEVQKPCPEDCTCSHLYLDQTLSLFFLFKFITSNKIRTFYLKIGDFCFS